MVNAPVSGAINTTRNELEISGFESQVRRNYFCFLVTCVYIYVTRF